MINQAGWASCEVTAYVLVAQKGCGYVTSEAPVVDNDKSEHTLDPSRKIMKKHNLEE